jgi:UDP-N-acetylglucosamine 2-epimerase
MKIVTVVGARPQFIKAAAISRAIRSRGDPALTEVLVHTGQQRSNRRQVLTKAELYGGVDAAVCTLAVLLGRD